MRSGFVADVERSREGVDAAITADRRLAIAAVDRLHEVRLLRLRRHARARAGALHVEDHERQFGHDGQTNRFGLQRHARALDVDVTAEAARVGSADGAADRGDLVFGLEGHDAQVLVTGSAECRMSDAGVIG
jgi:hypothetical protein